MPKTANRFFEVGISLTCTGKHQGKSCSTDTPKNSFPVVGHDQIGDSTMTDAILDRLVHNAYTIRLTEGSMRSAKGHC